MMQRKKRPLSISEFCQEKGISKSRAYQLTKLKTGALLTEMIGKMTVVPLSEAARWKVKSVDGRTKMVRE